MANKITNVVKNGVVYTLGQLTNAELTAITNDIAVISGIATGNTSEIANLSGSVTANTANISTISGDVNTISGKVDTNTANIATVSGKADTNASNISTISGNVTSLSGQVTTNTSDIATLKTSKQDKLTAGTGIDITDNVIKCTLDTSVFVFVDALPSTGIQTNKIYVIKSATGTTGNQYTEYYYKDGAWEEIGSFKADVDLSDYYKKSETDEKIQEATSGKVDTTVYTAYTASTAQEIALKADKTDLNTVSGKVDTNTTNIATISGNVTTISGDVKTISGKVDTNTTNIALKANSADVYTKTETYTKEEVDALANGKIVYLTLSEYEALTTKDPNTSYFIYSA